MRELSKPSTAHCNCSVYTLFLVAEPKYVRCLRLAAILADIGHDSVNRFLLRERYTPKDLFNEVKGKITLVGGTLSMDDSVEDKPYRDLQKSTFVGYFWSGKHKRTVKGIHLVALYYTDIAGRSYPIDFRIGDKREGKTKNDYFRAMVLEVRQWGIQPAWVTGNKPHPIWELKFLRHAKVVFRFGIADNRKVCLERENLVQVKSLAIPDSGLMVYRKEFGWV